MKNLIQNKKGGFVDIFLFMIIAITIVLFFVVLTYSGQELESKLHDKLDARTFGSENMTNYTATINETFGGVNTAYTVLYWVALFLIFGMIIAIFIGSYLVTTKPVFFIPYIIILIVAIICSVGISNAYEVIVKNATLAPTFNKFLGANFILLHLPFWVAIVGTIGGIIMFIRMQHGEEYYG